MARRSSSSRWSRPATGKQVAALKARGKYDGKYYSMGRASQAIGGSGKSSPSSVRPSSGTRPSEPPYIASVARGPESVGLFSRLFDGADHLDGLLQPALGISPRSPLAASESGPMNILSQLLDVPEDLDALVRVALGASDPDGASPGASDEPVASVLYTIRADDSDPAEPRIVIDAEVVHDSAFEGHPSVQVRFMGSADPGGHASLEPAATSTLRTALGYRPSWTPVLVRTPAALAEQMRTRWVDATREFVEGVDPRMATFLAGFRGMETALAVLNAGQSPASKSILLQGLLDPGGQIQFQGLGLDAATFADQIRLASDGDEQALDWLEAIQREGILTSLAEVTGIDLAAEADFRLTRWRQQGSDLIEAVTMSAEHSGLNFSLVRELLDTKATWTSQHEASRATVGQYSRTFKEWEQRQRIIERNYGVNFGLDRGLSSLMEQRRFWEAREREYGLSLGEILQQMNRGLDKGRENRFFWESNFAFGLVEDWFFDETRDYLHARFRRSLPAQFVAALTASTEDQGNGPALASAVRRMAGEASTDLADYSLEPLSAPSAMHETIARLRGTPYPSGWSMRRIQRIVEAVLHVTSEAEAASDDDLGIFIVAQEVLNYAQWRRDELRPAKRAQAAERQNQELEQQKAAAIARSERAEQRVEAAGRREQSANKARSAVDLERLVHEYVESLTNTPGPVVVRNPLPDSLQSAAQTRIKGASEREAAANQWLAAAEAREQWATTMLAVAATPGVKKKLRAERDAAVAEQSQAETEQRTARRERDAARKDLEAIAAGRSRFEVLIRPVREENARRSQAEAEARRLEIAREARRQAEERHRRQVAEQKRKEDANARQEELNQRQQESARAVRSAIAIEIERLLALRRFSLFSRRKRRASLERTISELQSEIAAPLVPPRTRSKAWPPMLSINERYLGTVKKLADYGAFVSLPAGTDGLLRGTYSSASLQPGQLVVVEIVDMPHGKPIVLKRV